MSNENLIERYVHEVGRNLPRRMRADVELELRSLLADSLEERQSGKNDDEVVIDLLEELGPPAEFAAQYLPEQKLIGPRLFPLFKLVLTIVLSVIGGLYLVLAVISFFQEPAASTIFGVFWWIGGRILSFGESAIYIFGIITLVFAVLEWVGAADVAETADSWHPQDLPEVEDSYQIKPFELILGIVFTTLLIVAINFFPNWLGLIDFAGEEWGIKVLWADGFYQHVPWLTALWLSEIALKAYVLKQKRWSKLSRGIEILVQLFVIYVLNRIFNGPPVLAPEFFDTMAKWIILGIIVITAIDTISKLYHIIVQPKSTPPSMSNGNKGFSFES